MRMTIVAVGIPKNLGCTKFSAELRATGCVKDVGKDMLPGE